MNDTDGNHINQTDHSPGGLKKSGWLSTKYILLYGRNGRVEHASNRKWKNHWVILKGCELNLYLQCDEKDVGSIDLHNPSNVMKLDGCLAQAVPEHAKLENVFGVSTQNGDVYYFQVLCCIAADLEQRRGVSQALSVKNQYIKSWCTARYRKLGQTFRA